MPGIVGCTNTSATFDGLESDVAEMRDLVAHRDEDATSEPRGGTSVRGASAIHHPPPHPLEAAEYHGEALDVWIDGEFLNLDAVEGARADTRGENPAGELGALYRRDDGLDVLEKLDGRFAVVVHDRQRGELHFATDRWGQKYLYVAEIDGEIAWSSEVKGFLGHSRFEPSVDPTSCEQFFEEGQFFGARSWFESVELVDPASVWTWDLREREFRKRRYWDWRELERDESISRSAARAELGERFEEAVRTRCREDWRYGIGLSGGLDSRAIVAALSPGCRARSHCLTFGLPDSREVEIARRVARRADLPHFCWELDESNWFEERIRGVWLTDGEFAVHYLHSLPCVARDPDPFEVNLNGFLGGAIQGGSYLGKEGTQCEEQIEGRGRRVIANGPRTYDVYAHTRCPFLDRDLLEFTLRLPREFLADGQLYDEMLLERYPEYFADIPDANTGRALGWSRLRKEVHKILEGPARQISEWLPGLSDPPRDDFKDYAKWFGGPTYRETIESILFDEPQLYREYVPDLPVRSAWERVLADDNSDAWEQIDLVLTFEIWLEQVFTGEFRPSITPQQEDS